MKKISVIIPVYNVEGEVARCIDSIINQTYSELEIIIVNDGSTDGSLEICKKYIDNRIRIIDKENGGLSDARNVGIKFATGDYILFVDSDDYIELNTCEVFINGICNLEPDLVIGDYYIESSNKKNIVEHCHLSEKVTYNSDQYLIESIKHNELRMEAWLNLYKRSFLYEHDLKFQKGIYHEDMQLLPHIILAAKSIVYIRNPFYHYIQREGSIMHQSNIQKRMNDMIDIYRQWLFLSEIISNKKAERYFKSFLVKCYLKTYTVFGGMINKYHLISKTYILRYSLGFKDKLKASIFCLSEKFYIYLSKRNQ